MPRRPRSQKLCTLVRRSANVVGVVSAMLSNTLMRPLFSATKTRPSEAKRKVVGSVSPEKTVVSWNPGGRRSSSGGGGVTQPLCGHIVYERSAGVGSGPEAFTPLTRTVWSPGGRLIDHTEVQATQASLSIWHWKLVA